MSNTSRPTRTREKQGKYHNSQPAQNIKQEGPSMNTKTQPTAEQLRLAQIVPDKTAEDSELKGKISQVVELTGRSSDEASVALFDCDNDTNKAVNLLLETHNDQGEWKETGKKKKRGQAAGQRNIDNSHSNDGMDSFKSDRREKSYDPAQDREESTERQDRPHRGNRPERPPRLSKGAGGRSNNWQTRENEENNKNRFDSHSRERPERGAERGGAGRGRGQGSGRGRGRGGRVYKGTRFDRAPQIDTWTNETAENAAKEKDTTFGGGWGDMMAEDWTADEWTGSLEESKVFTPSVQQTDGKIFSPDDDSNLFSPPVNDNDVKVFNTANIPVETQMFSASGLTTITNTNASPKMVETTSMQPSTLGQRLDLSALLGKPTVSNVSSSPQQSHYMSQFAKQATESIKNAVGIGNSTTSAAATLGSSPSQQRPIMTSQQQQSASQLQQRAVKPQRTKLPPPSKIPQSAVEMPGHMMTSLDVQFGNWDPDMGLFGSESSAVQNSFGSTSVSSNAVTLNNHLPSVSTPSEISTSTTSSIASSIMSNVTPPKSSMTALDSMPQSSPPSRNNMFQNNTATPTKDFSQTKVNSPPEPIPFPASQPDRSKSGPHFGTQRPSPGSLNSSKSGTSPQMAFNQSYPPFSL